MSDVKYQRRSVPISIGRSKVVELPDRAKEPEDKREELGDFVEIELVDDEGKPVAGARYRVTGPDGSVKEGKLDADGRARVEKLKPGLCRVSFPELDSGSWDAA